MGSTEPETEHGTEPERAVAHSLARKRLAHEHLAHEHADGLQGGSPDVALVPRPRRRPGENRERLLEAGIDVFGTFGYHGAATAAIARLAEVPQPHVYANFHTKQELFLACAMRVHERLADLAASAGDHEQASDASRYGAFLLQCFASAHEPKLQPQLGQLLRELEAKLGEGALVALLSAHVRGALSGP